MVSAISLGVFWREEPSTSAIILSRKLSPGWAVTLTRMRSERIFVPPVTELLSPPASRITGADSPVMALSSMEASPSMISPSAGIVSPATHSKTSPRFNSELLTVLVFPLPATSFAGVSSRVFRSESACALPRASAIASAKLANRTVSNKTAKTARLYQKEPCESSPETAI